MSEIHSETEFIWKFILDVLKTPFTLLMALFGQRSFGDVFQPFKDFFLFIIEPKFTFGIIIVNIALFFFSLFYLGAEGVASFINHPQHLLEFKWYTLITAGFLHADITHLLGNMLGIFIFGRVVERKLGFAKTAVVYFGALLLSSLFTSLIHLLILKDNIGGLGASGALMGLVSTAILLDPFYFTYELILPLPIMITGWLALYADITGLINPAETGIGHLAHVGGFISVSLLMFLISGEDRDELKKGLLINVVSFLIIVGSYFLLLKQGYTFPSLNNL